MKRISIVAAIAALSVSVSVYAQTTDIKVIYGEDNRRDVYQTDRSDIIDIADSTVAMISNSNLIQKNDWFEIKTKIYGEDLNLCKNEPFFTQPVAASCSGFLVGDDLVATAGHCISEDTCDANSFVFGYQMESATVAPREAHTDNVYKCAKVLAHDVTRDQDYALVKLDRPVRGHRVLTLSAQPVKVDDAVFVVGHPSGLPTKVSDGANVRKQENGYFVANLDTYGGNSGSAVFDAKTLAVAGILVRGEQDFEYDSAFQCRISKQCKDDKCRGEDVTNISYIAEALNQARVK
ncbi:MAG: serine protease [Bdellovibrionota bacterium]